MAPNTRANSAKAGAKDPNSKQTLKFKLDINTCEDDSKNTKRCRHSWSQYNNTFRNQITRCMRILGILFYVTFVISEDRETAFEDTANAAANVSAAPLDSIEPVQPRESAEVPSPTVPAEWNVRRPRTKLTHSKSSRKSYFYQYTYRRGGLPTRDEQEIADFLVTEDFRSEWAVGSAVATMVQMKKDPNYSAPIVQGGTWLNRIVVHSV